MGLQALASLGSGLLFVVLSVLGWLFRRQSREAREARKMESTATAGLRLWRQVQQLAAVEGWDQHPHWPSTPREMTLEYLFDQAEEPGGHLEKLAETVQKISEPTRGKP